MEATVQTISEFIAVASDVTYTLPVSPTPGDWILTIWIAGAASGSFPRPQSGWTTIRAYGSFNPASTSSTASFGVFAKIYASPEDLIWTTSSNVNTNRVKIITGSGAQDVSQWTIGQFVPRATNATTTTAVAPSVNATSKGLALAIAAERTIAEETSEQLTVTNFQKFAEGRETGTTVLTVLAKKRVEAGPTGDVTFGFPNPHAQNGIAGIVIIPDTVSVADNGIPVRIAAESGSESYFMKVATEDGLVTPRAMKAVSQGYGTVDNMLKQNPFKIAHRGGSNDFPEMSLYAYGQSALLGYDALELSLARTSDGVLFGLHDDTLLRTSGVDVLASSLTWEQVQAYTIFNEQPYMTFDELLAVYPHHVLFIDPKAIPVSLHDEVLDVMDSNGGPSRFIFKYYGASNYHLKPHERGYKTWGYFYETNIPTLDRWQAGWDLLGMEYTATQSAWDAIKALGRPVIGHICPSKAAADTAISKGATGLMVSGVRSV